MPKSPGPQTLAGFEVDSFRPISRRACKRRLLTSEALSLEFGDMGLSRQRKQEYFGKMEGLLDAYSRIFIVSCDNVGSKQFQQIRMALRGEAVVLMGKNTMMRKVVSAYLAKNPGHPYEMLLPKIMGNIGFVFTNGDLGKVRELIEDNRVPAPARVGAIAPIDVVVPPGPTDCDPGQTNFFQTLQIATKIVKGRIEITSPVNLLKAGDKVGNSEAVLLQKLHINPFDYGLVITDVYDCLLYTSDAADE